MPDFVQQTLEFAGSLLEPGDGLVAIAIVLVLAVLAVIVAALRRRRHGPIRWDDKIDPRDLPPLVFSPDRETRQLGSVPEPARAAAAVAAPAEPWPAAPVREPERPSVAGPPAGDETLQLLPGRLEYVNGGPGQEIRFVRPAGERRFTFGRSRGPAHTHVQIPAPTVSRMHAYMRFDAGVWFIGNLSRTNRVVVNDAPLDPAREQVLEDGDRIEMGEVTLVFRAR